MSNFKVGDKVKCVETDETHLSSDIEYTISEVKDSFIKLQGIPSAGFYQRRFEKVVDRPKIKAGMKVWSPSYGWGEVIDYQKNYTALPIVVNFDCDRKIFYTLDGKVSPSSILPTLFLDEVPASDWPNPPAKLNPSTFVVDQDLEVKFAEGEHWETRKFAAFVNDSVWVYFLKQDSKIANSMIKVVDFRLPIAPKGV